MDDALEVRGLQDSRGGQLTPAGVPAPPPPTPPGLASPALPGESPPHDPPQDPPPSAGAGPAEGFAFGRRPKVGRVIARGLLLIGTRERDQLARGFVPAQWSAADRFAARLAARYCIRLARWVLGR
jgi:hypothetical protein